MARWLLIYWIHTSILEWRISWRRGQKDLALLGSYNFGSMVLGEPRGALSTRLASRENVRANRTRLFSRVAVEVLLRITFPCVRLWVYIHEEIVWRNFALWVLSLFRVECFITLSLHSICWKADGGFACDQDGQWAEYIYLFSSSFFFYFIHWRILFTRCIPAKTICFHQKELNSTNAVTFRPVRLWSSHESIHRTEIVILRTSRNQSKLNIDYCLLCY